MMLEAVVIRFLWVLYAFRLKRTPGLCPPQCSECHTFRWPCRARVRDSWYSRYMARPKVHQQLTERKLFFGYDYCVEDVIATRVIVEEIANGIIVKGMMNDEQVEKFSRLFSTN